MLVYRTGPPGINLYYPSIEEDVTLARGSLQPVLASIITKSLFSHNHKTSVKPKFGYFEVERQLILSHVNSSHDACQIHNQQPKRALFFQLHFKHITSHNKVNNEAKPTIIQMKIINPLGDYEGTIQCKQPHIHN